jgi:hypothetical protein
LASTSPASAVAIPKSAKHKTLRDSVTVAVKGQQVTRAFTRVIW